MPQKTPRTPVKKEVDKRKEELNALVHLRGKAVEKLTRLKQKLVNLPRPERTVPTVKLNQRKLEMAYSEFSAIHEKVVTLVDPAERDSHDDLQLSVETDYDSIFVTLEKWAQDLVPEPAGPSNAVLPAAQRPVVIQQSLPRLVPTFDGKYKNWKRFKTMFRDVVDRSNETPRMKLYRLEEALIGEAKGTLDEKTIEDGNYDGAWEMLQERYEDNRRMIDIHIGDLLNLQKMSKESHTELRALVETVVGHVENLKYLKQEFLGVSTQFVVYLLVHALDDVTRKLLETTVKRGELPKYDEAVQFLKNRASVLERCEETNDAASRQREQTVSKPTTSGQPYQIANTAITWTHSKLRCDLCGGHHLTFKCRTFAGLTEYKRLDKVKEKKVCSSKKSCDKCQRRHHTLLHLHPPARQLFNQGQPSTTYNRTHTVKSVLLPTAVVQLRDDKNRPVPCRLLLDNGSQVNFISEQMVSRLNTQRVAASVPICGIGAASAYIREATTVQLQSRHSNFTENVECFIIPKVTGMIPSAKINPSDWPIPTDIQLADSNC